MASRRYVSLKLIIITICLDTSILLTTVVAWDSKTPRYDSYNLDKGPVIYEAYYPDIPKSNREKPYFDQSTVLETSFQIPFDRFAYSTETANDPVWNNESSAVANNKKRTVLKQQWKTIKTGRNYNSTNAFIPFHDKQSSATFDENKNTRNVNIEEISKLVRRAISRDLESWNILERYFERANNEARQILQPEMNLKKNHENQKEDYNYPFQIDQRTFDPSKQLNSKVQKLETRDVVERLPYLDASENTLKDKTIVDGTQAADASSINVISDSSIENIYQPRPQLIRYTFFRKLTPRVNEQIEKVIDESTLRNYGDNLIRKEMADDQQVKENVKITSIEVSKLPQHKIRHHHDEWLKRHYSIHHHRSQSTVYPINKEK